MEYKYETILRYSEDLSRLVLGLDPGETSQILEVQTVILEIGAELSENSALSALSENLSAYLDPIYSDSHIYETIKEKFFTGLDLLNSGIQVLDKHRESPPDEKTWDDLIGASLKSYFEDLNWTLPSYRIPEKKENTAVANEAEQEKDGSIDISLVQESSDETENEALAEVVSSEFFENFVTENRNRMLKAVDIILDLEDAEKVDVDTVNELFRLFHTMKGEAGFIGLPKLASITHDLETMLDSVRNGEINYSDAHAEALLHGEDLIKEHLILLEEMKFDEYVNKSVSKLESLISATVPRKHVQLGEILEETGALDHRTVEKIHQIQEKQNFSKRFGEIAEEEGLVSEEAIEKSIEIQKERNNASRESRKRDSFINIRASQILKMTTMIQELWIAENQIDDEQITPIKKITSQLQHLALGFLTEEVNKLYIKLRRIVRDTAKKAGKKIDVTFIGSEFEIDRKLVEALEEPLMHIIRNSIDHGIESEEIRKAAGKNEMGMISVSTARRGNRVIISVKDDGRGLNRDKISSKAIEKGIVSAEEVSKMSDERVFELITVPGFSTAEQLSQLSGRGVGMDAVVSMIQENLGRLEIYSSEGLYTQFDLIFPLNVAIVDGMVLKSAGDIFIVPISEIVECIQVSKSDIERIKGDIHILRLRGEVLPVISLEKVFGDLGKSSLDDFKAAVIVTAQKNKYAFLVSDILEKSEVAIKPLGKKFSTLKGISSGTVFSGGAIGFILDVEQIVEETALNTIQGGI